MLNQPRNKINFKSSAMIKHLDIKLKLWLILINRFARTMLVITLNRATHIFQNMPSTISKLKTR
jgi:hypothetical protein